VLATPHHLKQIEDLISQLDRPVSLRDSYIVYPVQNLVASELAQLIGPQVGAEVRVQGQGGGGVRQRAGGVSASRVGTGTTSSTRGGASRGLGLQTESSSPVARRSSDVRRGAGAGFEVEPTAGTGEGAGPPEPGVGVMSAEAVEAAAVEVEQVAPGPELPGMEMEEGLMDEYAEVPGAISEATITADDNANLLLITAPPEQVELIQQMLEDLDVLPPQVHIRAIIAEVSLTRGTKLGIQWSQLPKLGPFGKSAIEGAFTTDFGLGAGENGEDGGTTSALGLTGIITGDELAGVLTALTTDSKARILSAPSIFTSNNQPARITVSESRPFPTGTLTSTTAAGVISTSIQYLPVGIVLEVTPRVTQGDVVRMEVSVMANESGEAVKIAGQDYPSTKAREANAIVSVRGGNTIVLGGLMRESVVSSAERVPLLGDLPLIGSLFRSTSSTREKRELLVFLTPRVVRSVGETAQLAESEKSRLPEVPRILQGPAGGGGAGEGVPR
jgi:general secretion pathway protein D